MGIPGLLGIVADRIPGFFRLNIPFYIFQELLCSIRGILKLYVVSGTFTPLIGFSGFGDVTCGFFRPPFILCRLDRCQSEEDYGDNEEGIT